MQEVKKQRRTSVSRISLGENSKDDIALINVSASPLTPKDPPSPEEQVKSNEAEDDEKVVIIDSSSDSDETSELTASASMARLASLSSTHSKLLGIQPTSSTSPKNGSEASQLSPSAAFIAHNHNSMSDNINMMNKREESSISSKESTVPVAIQENTLLELLLTSNDCIRLQVLLALMSCYHQSVSNSLTKRTQQTLIDSMKNRGSDSVLKMTHRISGYYLCNAAYQDSIYQIIYKVLKDTNCRVITAQCCIYIMKYIISNEIYGEKIPEAVYTGLAEILKARSRIVLEYLSNLKGLMNSIDDTIYVFLSTYNQVCSTIGTIGFMTHFDYKGILESTSLFLSPSQVTDISTTSVPLLYKYTHSSTTNQQYALQAFTQQLHIFLLIRAFIFYITKKQYPDLSIHEEMSPEQREETPEFDSFSPIPITPVLLPSVLPIKYAHSASVCLGIAVDNSGDDLELQKTINPPSIAVSQKVEFSRVNRYFSCLLLPPKYLETKASGTNAYLTIGRSQLSILEMMKGSLKDAFVKIVFSLYELLDICIEDDTTRTLSILIQTDKQLDNCEKLVGYTLQNRPGRIVYKMLIQFATAPSCLEAQRCIMVARSKDMEKRNRDIEKLLINNANSTIAKIDAIVFSVNE